jgi:hypothetical protein
MTKHTGVALFLILFISSCSMNSIKTIDGCQYIETYSINTQTVTLTHKGNCNNPIHKGGNK